MVTCLCEQAFDDLLLMKIGGRIIYHGELGKQSSKLVAYFEVSLQGPLSPHASGRLASGKRSPL